MVKLYLFNNTWVKYFWEIIFCLKLGLRSKKKKNIKVTEHHMPIVCARIIEFLKCGNSDPIRISVDVAYYIIQASFDFRFMNTAWSTDLW